MQPAEPTQTTGGPAKRLGIAAIVCGGVGVLIPGLAIIGLILGVIGLIVAKPGLNKLPVIGTTVSGVAMFLNVVVLILIAFMLPQIAAAVAPASLVQEQQQLREIATGYYAWSVDNKGLFPAHAEDALLYLNNDSQVFVAPVDRGNPPALVRRDDMPMLPYTYGSFEFMPLAGVTTDSIRDPSTFLIAYSASPRGRYRVVVFLDGHTDAVAEDEFQRVKQDTLDALPPAQERDLIDGVYGSLRRP
ncbi:MAG: hypothetical protein ACE37H_05385 [Phycisphaeraceae bacterium]